MPPAVLNVANAGTICLTHQLRAGFESKEAYKRINSYIEQNVPVKSGPWVKQLYEFFSL